MVLMLELFSNIKVCPAVCVEQLSLSVVLLGLFFGAFAVVLFIASKNTHKKSIKRLFWLSLIIFLLYSVQIKYDSCASGCESSGFIFKGIKLLPSSILPFI